MRPSYRSFCALAAVALTLSACATASTYQPVVDMKNVNPQKYQQDLAECRQYAEQVDVAGNGATDTLLGAGLGAAAGAALGAISGAPATGAALGATVGGFGGGGAGVANSVQRQQTIINNCLKGRGYNVLG